MSSLINWDILSLWCCHCSHWTSLVTGHSVHSPLVTSTLRLVTWALSLHGAHTGSGAGTHGSTRWVETHGSVRCICAGTLCTGPLPPPGICGTISQCDVSGVWAAEHRSTLWSTANIGHIGAGPGPPGNVDWDGIPKYLTWMMKSFYYFKYPWTSLSFIFC